MEYLTDADFEMAEANGINRQLAYNRFYRIGWSKEKAITTPVQKRIWPKYKEEAEDNGVTKGMFFRRIHRGIEPEEAIAMGYIGYEGRKYAKPVRVDRIALEIAEANGIPNSTVQQRVYRCGWDLERAITEPVHIEKRKHSLGR